MRVRARARGLATALLLALLVCAASAFSAAQTANTPPDGYIDAAVGPTGTSTVPQGTVLSVNGWAVDQEDGAPVTRVQVLIDGIGVGDAALGFSRPDVASYFGNAAWTNSGWRFSITPSLTPGQHTVDAVAYDSKGATTTLRNSLTITSALSVAVSPSSASVVTGGTQQFTATVTGGAGTVTWSVNDVVGGNLSLGTITAAGLYAAPAALPTPNPVTVKATSTVDTTRSGSSSVTINNPAPSISSISPTSITATSGDTGLTVNGTLFVAQSLIEFAGIDLATTFQSSTQLTAIIPASMLVNPGTIPITVQSPSSGISNAKNLTIAQAVTVSPSAKNVPVNWTRLFTATVSGETDQSVTWMVNDVVGGSAATGTITAAGIYQSPPSVPGANLVTVKAVSVANPSKYGTATVTIILPISDNYPRSDATSVLRSQPPLTQVPLQGTIAAVLDWTAKDSSAANESITKVTEVLAVCHNLSEMGIPHVHTTDWATAAAYPMVAVAGVLETNSVNDTERDAIAAYVQNGGTLLLWRTADSGLLSRLGVSASTKFSGTTVRPVSFNVQTQDGALRYIDDDPEVNWQMAYWQPAPTREYTTGSATVLATWTSGLAAVLRSNLGTGRAYVFGWRLKIVLADAEQQKIPGAEPQWTNTRILDADISRLLARAIYETLPGSPHVHQFAPGGKPAALILTHDVDAGVSYTLTPEFVQMEQAHGVKSTYLFTTSPFDTGWVGNLYNATSKQNIQYAVDQGFDVESHSIGHFRQYDKAALGTGTEDASNYFPHYSADLNQTIGMSAIGETGVSRWLLEKDFGITVGGFRSGYLLLPAGHLDSVRQTGYRRDSTYAAGLTRGFAPFVPFTVSNGVVTTYPFMEYPYGLGDSNPSLTADNLQAIVSAWETVIRTNYKNGVPTVLNVHPVNAVKKQAEEELLQRISDLNLWIGDWKTFDDFWQAQGVTCSRWP